MRREHWSKTAGGKGLSHVHLWGKNIPGRDSGKCKGPGAEARLGRSKHGKDVSVAGVESARAGVKEMHQEQ